MHHVAGDPHAHVVVQVTGGVQRSHGNVDDGNAGSAFANVVGQLVGIAAAPRQLAVHVAQNAVAAERCAAPHMVKELAPAKFEHQFVVKAEREARVHFTRGFRHAQHTVGEIRRQARHLAIQRVAGAGVSAGLHQAQTRQSSGVSGLKSLQCGWHAD